MKKTTFTVGIENIQVDKRYYSFNYVIFRNGNIVKRGEYESDHAWADDVEGFKDYLDKELAANIALSNNIRT